MSCGPHQMNIGWLVLSSSRTAVRRLCGQVSGRPSGLNDQSWARISAPISPPPARKSPALAMGTLTFNMQRNPTPSPIPPTDSAPTVYPTRSAYYRPELSRLSHAVKRADGDIVQIYFAESGTKYGLGAAGINHAGTAGQQAPAPALLFHQAGGRQRAGDDGPDIDRPAARLRLARLGLGLRLCLGVGLSLGV